MLEASDVARARQHARRLQRMAEQARGVIRRAMAGGPVYVSCSWGKDSVVCLDLALSVDPSVPVVHIVQGAAANPDDLITRDAALERWALRYIEIDWPRNEEYTWRSWEQQCRDAAVHGRRITGIRAEESATRSMSAAVHGQITEQTCRPILWWSQADLWAWIALRDLPAHPVYAMTMGGAIPRDSLRVAGLLDYDQFHSRGTGHGRAEWEQHYYGSTRLLSYREWAQPKEVPMDRDKGKP